MRALAFVGGFLCGAAAMLVGIGVLMSDREPLALPFEEDWRHA